MLPESVKSPGTIITVRPRKQNSLFLIPAQFFETAPTKFIAESALYCKIVGVATQLAQGHGSAAERSYGFSHCPDQI